MNAIPLVHDTTVYTKLLVLSLSRRVFCLLENQQPLVLDAMGTAYVVARGEVQEQRPAPLRHAHVQAFRNRYMSATAVIYRVGAFRVGPVLRSIFVPCFAQLFRV